MSFLIASYFFKTIGYVNEISHFRRNKSFLKPICTLAVNELPRSPKPILVNYKNFCEIETAEQTSLSSIQGPTVTHMRPIVLRQTTVHICTKSWFCVELANRSLFFLLFPAVAVSLAARPQAPTIGVNDHPFGQIRTEVIKQSVFCERLVKKECSFVIIRYNFVILISQFSF